MEKVFDYQLSKQYNAGFVTIGEMAKQLSGSLTSIDALHEINDNNLEIVKLKEYDIVIVIADVTNEERLAETKMVIEKIWGAKILAFPIFITEHELSFNHPIAQISPTDFSNTIEMQKAIIASVQGFLEMICLEGMVSLDLDSVKIIFDGCGCLKFSQGIANIDDGCIAAAQDAMGKIKKNLSVASVIVVNIVGNDDNLSMFEIMECINFISDELASNESSIIWGAQVDNKQQSTVKVLVWARG